MIRDNEEWPFFNRKIEKKVASFFQNLGKQILDTTWVNWENIFMFKWTLQRKGSWKKITNVLYQKKDDPHCVSGHLYSKVLSATKERCWFQEFTAGQEILTHVLNTSHSCRLTYIYACLCMQKCRKLRLLKKRKEPCGINETVNDVKWNLLQKSTAHCSLCSGGCNVCLLKCVSIVFILHNRWSEIGKIYKVEVTLCSLLLDEVNLRK